MACRLVCSRVCGMIHTVRLSGRIAGHGQADAVDGDGPLEHDQLGKFLRQRDVQAVIVALFLHGSDGARAIDVPLDEMPAQPAIRRAGRARG